MEVIVTNINYIVKGEVVNGAAALTVLANSVLLV